MERRHFLGLATVFPFLGSRAFVSGAAGFAPSSFSGIIAAVAKGENLAPMFDRSIDALGGLAQFVKRRGKVTVKPSAAYNRTPETGWNSNPQLTEHIIKTCYKLGARFVSLFEQTVDTWTLCYKNSGIERVTKDARARMWPGNNEDYYKPVDNSAIKIHSSLADTDLIINLVVVNTGRMSPIGGAIENYLHGAWNYATFTAGQMIDALKIMPKPQLTISEIRMENTQALVVSLDMVAADAVAAQLLRIPGSEIFGLNEAGSAGIGNGNPAENQIVYVR